MQIQNLHVHMCGVVVVFKITELLKFYELWFLEFCNPWKFHDFEVRKNF